jgi:hypothetical protein
VFSPAYYTDVDVDRNDDNNNHHFDRDIFHASLILILARIVGGVFSHSIAGYPGSDTFIQGISLV